MFDDVIVARGEHVFDNFIRRSMNDTKVDHIQGTVRQHMSIVRQNCIDTVLVVVGVYISSIVVLS
jgi:hypothetical protein